MSTPTFLFLLVLFIVAAGIIVLNVMGDPGIDYWDLDGEKKPPVSRFDILRRKPAIYMAGIVLIATFIAYLVVRQ